MDATSKDFKNETRIGMSIALLSMVGVITVVAGGCRFGNYSSSNVSGTSDSDPVTGYYDAVPQSLEYCAAVSTSANTSCVRISTTEIPSFLANNITNPLALILQDPETGEAAITAAVGGGKSALPIDVAADNTKLYYTGSSSPEVLYLDSSCTTRFSLEQEGTIVRGTGHHVQGTQTGRTVGSLTLTALVVRTFAGVNGSCQAELQAMSTCYQNVANCGGSSTASNQARQERVREIFEEYIHAGAMTAADIPHVTGLAYEASYR